MGNTKPALNFKEAKHKAKLLLEDLKSEDTTKSLAAAKRVTAQCTGLSIEKILSDRTKVDLRQALNVIAMEKGLPDGKQLKDTAEKDQGNTSDLYPRHCSTFLNDWQADYDIVKEHQTKNGGYLPTYKKYFFICSKEYIECLGLDPQDPDCEKIEFDWARPKDLEAWERLEKKAPKNQG